MNAAMNAQTTHDREIITTYETICDLRQPLTTAIGRCQMARRRLKNGDYDKVASDLRIIEEQAWRLAAMLRELAEEGRLAQPEEIAATSNKVP